MEEIKYTVMSRESRLCQPSSSRVFLEKECELGQKKELKKEARATQSMNALECNEMWYVIAVVVQ